jgi:hypothetical protein
VLTVIGVWLWSRWLLVLAAILSLPFSLVGSVIFGNWMLLLPVIQVAIAMTIAIIVPLFMTGLRQFRRRRPGLR